MIIRNVNPNNKKFSLVRWCLLVYSKVTMFVNFHNWIFRNCSCKAWEVCILTGVYPLRRSRYMLIRKLKCKEASVSMCWSPNKKFTFSFCVWWWHFLHSGKPNIEFLFFPPLSEEISSQWIGVLRCKCSIFAFLSPTTFDTCTLNPQSPH